MSTAQPADRAFAFFRRGEQREDILTSFRYRLRQLTNPVTGVPFTETEIAAATSRNTRWWIDAEAMDLILLAGQSRALLLADQIRPDRANSEYLRGYHGQRFSPPLAPLPASGGSGAISAPGIPGTVFLGSTTVPDPAATFLVSPDGLRFQVLFTETIAPDGIHTISGDPVQVQAIDTGTATNLPAGALLTNGNGPPGWVGPATVIADFRGGAPQETDAQFARRIMWRERHKQGSGNEADFRAWAQDATNSVEDAFVFACALQAGSVLVVVTQKRGDVIGPLGRFPSIGTLTRVTAKIVPPGSSDTPAQPFVLTTGPVTQSVDLVARLSMPKKSASGWEDLHPWPTSDNSGTPVTITTLTTQTDFRITISGSSTALPPGITAPSLMVWNVTKSRYERLLVQSVTLVSGNVYHVILNGAPSFTIATGDYVCPSNSLRDTIGETTETYFDSLGPGEAVDLSGSLLSARAARFPAPSEEWPQRAGATLETYLDDALGSALGDRDLPFISASLPSVPSDPANRPFMLVPGHVGYYPL